MSAIALLLCSGLAAAEADPLADAIGRLGCYRDAACTGLAARWPERAVVAARPAPPRPATWDQGSCAAALDWAARAATDLCWADACLRGAAVDPAPLLLAMAAADAGGAVIQTHRRLLGLLATAEIALTTPSDTPLGEGVAVRAPAVPTASLPLLDGGSAHLPAGIAGCVAWPLAGLLALPDAAVDGARLPALSAWQPEPGATQHLADRPCTWVTTDTVAGQRLALGELVLGESSALRLHVGACQRAWWDGRPLPVAADPAAAVDLMASAGRHRLLLLLGDGQPAAPAITIAPAPRPHALGMLLARAGIAPALVDEPVALATRLTETIGRRSRDCRSIAAAGGAASAPLWPLRNRWAAPLWLRADLTGKPGADWQPAAGWLPAELDAGLLALRDLHWHSGWRTEDLYGRSYFAEAARVGCDRLFADGQAAVVLATCLDNDRPRLIRPLAQGPTVRLWLSGEALVPDEVVRVLPGRHPLLLLIERPQRVPKHLLARIVVELGLQQVDRIDDLDAGWLARLAEQEHVLRWLRGRLDEAPALDGLLQALAESRLEEGR